MPLAAKGQSELRAGLGGGEGRSHIPQAQTRLSKAVLQTQMAQTPLPPFREKELIKNRLVEATTSGADLTISTGTGPREGDPIVDAFLLPRGGEAKLGSPGTQLRCTEGRSRGLPVTEDVGAVALPETGQGNSGTRTLAGQSGPPHRWSNFN